MSFVFTLVAVTFFLGFAVYLVVWSIGELLDLINDEIEK
jgi:hypothetical protein